MELTITYTIKSTIKEFPAGEVFSAKDFPVDVAKQKTVNKILDNMVATGHIRRLMKGRFYKPIIMDSGEQPLEIRQIVKDILEKNGKTIGYLTGSSIFYELGVTAQKSFDLQIALPKNRIAAKRGIYRITFIAQQNRITKTHIPLLQLLDCLRFFKNIPDTMPDKTCRRLFELFRQLDNKQIATIKQLALNYSPQTIAMLGAILETLNQNEDTTELFHALNHQTSYQLGISNDVLLNQKKWHIR